MTAWPIRRSAEAEEDLLTIWATIAVSNERAADAILDRINERWGLLATQPRSGMEYSALPGVRRIVIGNYLTFYSFQDETILILRVLHGKRDIDVDDIVARKLPD